MNSPKENTPKTIMVLGGTGKTGRRVADKLRQRDWPVRIGSRSGSPPFEWPNTTAAVKEGSHSASGNGIFGPFSGASFSR